MSEDTPRMSKKQRRQLNADDRLVAASSVKAGFRAGKRKRGVSPQRRKPNEVVRTMRFTITDDRGCILAEDADMVTYKPIG